MKKSLGLFAAALMLAIPAAAEAQTDGFYVTPKIGFSYFRGDNETTISGAQEQYTPMNGHYGDRGGKSAFAGALAVGYGFSGQGVPVRLEVEYAHRAKAETSHAFDIGSCNGQVGTCHFNNRQKLDIGTLMGNVYLDFENDSAVTPYIGAGLGVAFIDGDNRFDHAIIGEDPGSVNAGVSERKFAWNLNAGAAFALSDNISLDLGYRYFHIGDVDTGNWAEDSGNLSFESGQTALHEAMLGLRFTYN